MDCHDRKGELGQLRDGRRSDLKGHFLQARAAVARGTGSPHACIYVQRWNWSGKAISVHVVLEVLVRTHMALPTAMSMGFRRDP